MTSFCGTVEKPSLFKCMAKCTLNLNLLLLLLDVAVHEQIVRCNGFFLFLTHDTNDLHWSLTLNNRAETLWIIGCIQRHFDSKVDLVYILAVLDTSLFTYYNITYVEK